MPFKVELYSMAPNSRDGAGGQNLGHIYYIKYNSYQD